MTTTRPNTSHWHILGAGAIGCLWACHLSINRVPVHLVLRNQQRLDNFCNQIRLSGQTDNATLTLTVQSSCDTDPIHHLLVTTKSYDTAAAIKSIQHRLTPSSIIVLLQNGMGQQRQTSELLPDAAIYGATTTEGAFQQPPDQLIHAGCGESWIGPMNDRAYRRGSSALSELLKLKLKTGYDVDIEQRLWQKLAINAAINGLTAQHQCQNGELVRINAYHDEMTQLCHEVEAVAQALKQPLFERPLIEKAGEVAIATAKNYSSMLQDVRHHRRTEIDYINGYIVQKARQLGIDTPLNQALIRTIKNLHP